MVACMARNHEPTNPAPATPAPFVEDRLLDFRRVNELVGSRSRTAHTARAMARRGEIEAVRINARVLRYRESSVLRLVRGETGRKEVTA